MDVLFVLQASIKGLPLLVRVQKILLPHLILK
jgi:hypothetical protein